MIAVLPAPIVPIAIAAPAPVSPSQADILAAMTDSAAGWNAGDLDRFMRVYGDDATYVTGKGLVRGKAAIADTYRKSFVAGGNARGQLSFGDTHFRTIDPTHVLLWARWTLSGAKPAAGMTTLLFERRRDGWRIISDHSS